MMQNVSEMCVSSRRSARIQAYLRQLTSQIPLVEQCDALFQRPGL